MKPFPRRYFHFLVAAFLFSISLHVPSLFAETITNEKLQEMLTQAGMSGRPNGASDITSQTVSPKPKEEAKPQTQIQPQPIPVKSCGQDDLDVLFAACGVGNVSDAKNMLDKGCDIDTVIREKTFLTVAAALGQEQIVRLLLKRGATIDKPDLINGRTNLTALAYAARRGHPNVAKILMDAGANPNGADTTGVTTLMATIMNGHSDMVKLLVQKGADVNAIGPSGFRALDLALSAGDRDMISALRSAGAIANPKVEARYAGGGGANARTYATQDHTTQSSGATSIPSDVLARIKADIASRYPDSYLTQEMLIKTNVESWQRLQRNFTDVPDSVFFQIRDNIASRYPDSYSTQETLIKAEVESWRKLNGR